MKAIIILGRGIYKDIFGKWKPTEYFEKADRGRHTGIYFKNPSPCNVNTIVSGGMTNTKASFYLYKRSINTYSELPTIIFAAGRPNYLSKEVKSLNEGIVMESEFLKLATKGMVPTPKTIILPSSKNTRDDMKASFITLKKNKIHMATIVTVREHIPRAKEFLKLAIANDNDNFPLEMLFKASEDILSEASLRNKIMFMIYKKTLAYKKTTEMERNGLNALKSGSYNLES